MRNRTVTAFAILLLLLLQIPFSARAGEEAVNALTTVEEAEEQSRDPGEQADLEEDVPEVVADGENPEKSDEEQAQNESAPSCFEHPTDPEEEPETPTVERESGSLTVVQTGFPNVGRELLCRLEQQDGGRFHNQTIQVSSRECIFQELSEADYRLCMWYSSAYSCSDLEEDRFGTLTRGETVVSLSDGEAQILRLHFETAQHKGMYSSSSIVYGIGERGGNV